MTAHSGERRSKGAGFLRSLAAEASVVACILLGGCRQDMHNQPKMLPQRGTTLFADGRSARPQVTGTVARSQGGEDSYFLTGMVDGKEGDGLPFPLTMTVMQRGQERYNIYCTPCHSRVGNGLGMIVQRGYLLAGNFHTERLRQAPLGHFFNVMTNGYGAMPNYAAELTPEDRWAVVSYIRALQLSQNATASDIKPGEAISPLADIASREGFPPGFAGPWRPPLSTPVLPVASTPVSSTKISSPPPEAAKPAQAETTPGGAPKPAKLAESQTSATPTGAIAAPVRKPAAAKPSAEDIAAGQQLYAQNCQACHQPGRTGLPPAIPSLIGIVEKIGAAHVQSTITQGVPTGKPPMPAFSNLSSEEIDKLIAFLAAGK